MSVRCNGITICYGMDSISMATQQSYASTKQPRPENNSYKHVLAELELVGEARAHDVHDVRGVGDPDVELVVRGQQVLLTQLCWNDVCHLQHRCLVLAHGLGDTSLHAVQELHEDTGRQWRHVYTWIRSR